ncbi:MAG TPA: selenocysteine-specific translation elongation factor [Acidimicrobiales bacterium]|nr:selenocysteine-specific translation elongation factor [Acidimicrobiales bacterium]
MHVVATAGHVDHGKSTLVMALTGMDPDRFAEEKARGLTIDLGFAWTRLPSGDELAFVDVPGHVKFLKNMLAGVGAVDACLFVVAATEGWKPQSEEHLRILELLGIRHGVVALTKTALVDDDDRELAHMEIAESVEGTFLAAAPVIDVDTPTGVGLDAVRAALDAMLARTPRAPDAGRPRLWVDRSFAARGSGTVVTGTLAGGPLALDDELALLPAGRRVRVRGLQTHQTSLEVADPGRRLAVNVTGVAHDEVERGDVLVRPGQWAPTRAFDASLTVLASLDHEVSRRGAYVAHIGSGEHSARVRVLGSDALEPGTTGSVRLHLPVVLPLLPGDRYILRESGRGETVGGGEVLDVEPVLPASKAAPSRSVERVVAERGWVEAGRLEQLTGERREPGAGRWVVHPPVLAATQERLRELAAAAGPLGLDVASLDERERAVLAGLDDLVIDGGRVRPRAAGAQPDPLADHPFVAALEAAPFSPPTPAEAGVDRAELRELVRRGLVVERDGFYFAPSAIDAAVAVVAETLAANPEGITVAQLRDALGTTRKYLLPLLAHFDASGITRRRGDLRIAGPRLAP